MCSDSCFVGVFLGLFLVNTTRREEVVLSVSCLNKRQYFVSLPT